MKVIESILEIIGNTPIVKLDKIFKGLNSSFFAKLEMFNPGGSIKDRVALAMIEAAEKNGKISKNNVIIEPTSGNTGIGLALVSLSKGYKVKIVMPENVSKERIKILKLLGAEIILTSKDYGIYGTVEKVKEIISENKGYFYPSQFENPENPKIHENTTAREIIDFFKEIGENPDYLVCGIGTGGTITGLGKALKKKYKNIKIIGVEPLAAAFISKGIKGVHKIEGIGPCFIPKILDLSIIDEIVTVSDEDAINTTKELAQKEGILAGISSGAALFAAKKIAEKVDNKNFLIIFPDSAERYFSTDLFKDENI